MENHERRSDWTVVAAIALIGFGVWFLLGNIFGSWWQDAVRQFFRIAWPIALIVLGILLYIGSSRGGAHVGRTGTRLYRSRSDRMVGGVLAGIGQYFGIDPTIVRIAYAVLGLLAGVWPAIVFYIVAMIVIPEEPAGAGAQAPQWPQPQSPVSPPPAGAGWAQSGWPHTETVQTPPPVPETAPETAPEPPAEPSVSAEVDDDPAQER